MIVEFANSTSATVLTFMGVVLLIGVGVSTIVAGVLSGIIMIKPDIQSMAWGRIGLTSAVAITLIVGFSWDYYDGDMGTTMTYAENKAQIESAYGIEYSYTHDNVEKDAEGNRKVFVEYSGKTDTLPGLLAVDDGKAQLFIAAHGEKIPADEYEEWEAQRELRSLPEGVR